jgi:hypothetical protein
MLGANRAGQQAVVMAMRHFWRRGLLPALMLFATAEARAQFSPDADCAKLSMRLAGIPEAAAARCSGGGEEFGDEFIDASGPGTVFVIRHQRGGLSYYLEREEVTHIVKKMMDVGKAEDAGEPFEVEDFDVVRYKTKAEGTGAPVACFTCLNYAGHVDHTTGYRHAIIGSDCDLSGSAPSDARIGELLGAIDADFW